MQLQEMDLLKITGNNEHIKVRVVNTVKVFHRQKFNKLNSVVLGNLYLFECSTVLKLFLEEEGIRSRGVTTLKKRIRLLQALHAFERWHIIQQGKLWRETVRMEQFLLCISLRWREDLISAA